MTEEQRSAAWFQARIGHVTASRIADLTARTKSGFSSSRANYLAELLLERLMGIPTEGFVSPAMTRGIELESEARDAYAWRADCEVEQVGFLHHPTIDWSGCSPDGTIGTDGLVEIKCMMASNHLETLLSGEIADKYVKQMQFQMAVTGRAWSDFAAYHPQFPDAMRLFVKRVPRDDAMIADLEKQVIAFLEELDAKLCALRSAYDLSAVLKESANEHA